MLPVQDIDDSLLVLSSLYDAASRSGSSSKIVNFYCKLALIELCGWTEQAFDDLIVESAQRASITDTSFLDNQIKRTYSFHYIEGFRPLLVSLIGTKECEKIEQKLLHTPASKFDAFKNCLSNLKSHRNTHAHTHLNNTTPQILSPSSLRTQRKLIGDALLEIENELRALGY